MPPKNYYHLRKVREACIENEQVVVPLGRAKALGKIEKDMVAIREDDKEKDKQINRNQVR